jgi:DNA-binding PadR family transcriptional regulator
MAKVSKTENKFWIVDRLAEIAMGKQDGTTPHLLRTIEDKGFIEPVSIKVPGKVGKPKKGYVLTKTGKTYLAFSKNWPRPEGMKPRASDTYRTVEVSAAA